MFIRKKMSEIVNHRFKFSIFASVRRFYMKRQHIFIVLVFTILFVIIGFDAWSLPPPPPPPGPGPGCWPPPCNPIPIDGGLSYLLAAGAVLGGRKLYKMHKEG
jgi:hypothetical protein